MTDDGTFFWSLMFGAIGTGYFIYGKNQANLLVLIIGILLCAFPYFVTGLWPTLAVGAGLVFAPMFLKQD